MLLPMLITKSTHVGFIYFDTDQLSDKNVEKLNF